MWVVSIYMYITLGVYEGQQTKCPRLWIWYVISITYLFFLSKVFYDFQCISLSLYKEPFVLPCMAPLESGIRKMGSSREWMSLPSPLYLLSSYLPYRSSGPCPSPLPTSEPHTGNVLWIWVFTLLLGCLQALSQCLPWVQEPQVYLDVNDLIRPWNHLE